MSGILHTAFKSKLILTTKHHIDIHRYVIYNSHIDTYEYDKVDMKMDYLETAKIFKAFCDGKRLQVLEMLTSGEKCACELLEHLDIGQSTLSHHMKILCDSDIVTCQRDGKWMYYSINIENCTKIKGLIDLFTTINKEDSLKSSACKNNKTCT